MFLKEKKKKHQILSPGKLKPISTILLRNNWNIPENLNDGKKEKEKDKPSYFPDAIPIISLDIHKY